jgi:hypothetical protein
MNPSDGRIVTQSLLYICKLAILGFRYLQMNLQQHVTVSFLQKISNVTLLQASYSFIVSGPYKSHHKLPQHMPHD